MSRFKKGDRVVLLRDSATGLKIGDAGIVYGFGIYADRIQVRVLYDRVGERLGIEEGAFELEAVFNSPLYKALS